MHKAGAFLLLLLLGLPCLLFAQEDSDPDIDIWDGYNTDLYTRGDQTFIISLGIGFPLAFVSTHAGSDGITSWRAGDLRPNKVEPPIGGTGALSYSYYFSSLFFLGGEVSLLFLPTLGDHVVYITSIGVRTGTQFVLGRFEFPISATLGITIQTHSALDSEKGYFGFYMKAGASAFFRATHEWSFGLSTNYCWYPQWIKNDPSKNVDGHFIDLLLCARYHF